MTDVLVHEVDEMKTLYVEFSVSVRDSQYRYDKPSGEAEIELKLLPSMLGNLPLANLFTALLKTAKEKYNASLAALKEEERGTLVLAP